jgi:alpha-L-rhamnosidase
MDRPLIWLFATALTVFAATPQGDAGAAAVPENLRCESARNPVGIGSATPYFSWTLRLLKPGLRDVTQTGYQILVASSSAALAEDRGNLWDSGRIASSKIFGIEYAGKPLACGTRYYWKARAWDGNDQPSPWSEPGAFTTVLLRSSDWTGHWIAAEPDGPVSTQARESDEPVTAPPKPLPLFRRGFEIQKQVTQALLFVSGLGQYEVHLNGRGITDDVLRPGWTDYRKRVPYDTYDVTTFLHPGPNALGVMLGNGMYNVEAVKGRYTKFVGSFGQPKLILQLCLRFADGTETDIVSDKTWKTVSGPVIFSSTYGGEDYDARLEPEGWDRPGFDDRRWAAALEVGGPGGELFAEQIPPIRPSHVYRPAKITQPKPRLAVYDLGQNMAGWPEISVSGVRGSSVKLIAGELLAADGTVTQLSAHAFPDSQNSFTYILKGAGVEHWHPRFSYYGFRYVQVERAPPARLPVLHSLDGQFLHDDVQATGAFTSSDDLFVRIHTLIDRAILSNMVSVLTDCPQREKLGWLEQTHLAATSIMYNYDVSRLYEKMSGDIEDEQQPNGMAPSIAPEYVAFVNASGKSTDFRDSPEWGSAAILSPWAAYQFYGSLENLREHYESMKRYAEYLGSRAEDHMLAYGLGDWYDIGPGEPGESQLTGKGLTATAIYYQDLTALAKISSLLDKTEDSAAFSAEAAAVKTSFNAHLFHPDTNQYDRGSQTANAMALTLDLTPEDHRAAVLANLVEDIRKHSNHVTAGDIGFHYVVRALTDSGRSDVLYDMLSRTDSPSYGYQLSRGATTLTEAWDTNPKSSQNHFMLGHAEEWFYRGLAGIDFDLSRAPDERIRIEPAPVDGISSASASFESVLGRVESRWVRHGNTLSMDVTVPPGASATVLFPAGFQNAIPESGHALTAGYRHRRVVGSGVYHFEARTAKRKATVRNSRFGPSPSSRLDEP